jgi:glycerol-3-phosphate acyltransferase PlsX
MSDESRSATASRRYRIAVDAMGGDHAPREIVRGALLASAEYPVDILLVGREEDLRRELAEAEAGATPGGIEIIDAREVVEMSDTALSPLRRKRNSSIRVCANLVGEGRADAMVSAGNTGATWTSAKAVVGMIEGVSRPALAAVVPRIGGRTVLLDVGANVDSKPQHLREFAVMGHFYAQVLGIEHPRVGLLSIGEEEGKGNELTRETFAVLKETGLNFIGNAEGRDVYNGKADVVVCDGFVGNVVLKASEALGEMVKQGLREEMTKGWMRKLGYLFAKGGFDGLKKKLDYSEYGGAPLLGIKGVCVVSHGRSNAKAMKNAIRVALEVASNDIAGKIANRIGELHAHEREEGLVTADVT